MNGQEPKVVTMTDVTPREPRYRQLAAPATVVVVCVTVVVLAMIGAFTALALGGRPADDLSRFVNTIMNLGSVILSGGAFAYAGSADRKAGRAVENTNGALAGALDERVTRVTTEVIMDVMRDLQQQPPTRQDP